MSDHNPKRQRGLGRASILDCFSAFRISENRRPAQVKLSLILARIWTNSLTARSPGVNNAITVQVLRKAWPIPTA